MRPPVGTRNKGVVRMARTEAQKRARNKYRNANIKQVILRYYPGEEENLEKAKRLGTPKIKELIAEYKE